MALQPEMRSDNLGSGTEQKLLENVTRVMKSFALPFVFSLIRHRMRGTAIASFGESGITGNSRVVFG